MMIPPDPGSSLPPIWSRLGETLSIALLGTTIAAVFALAGQSVGGKEHRAVQYLPVSGSSVSRFDPAASTR